MKDNRRFVLDTSAILAYLHGEKGGDKIIPLKGLFSIPFMAITELYYIVWQKKGKVEANRVYARIKSWNIPMLLPDERIALTAGRFKAVYHLGMADSYIAAISKVRDEILIAKDKDYKILMDEIEIFWL